MTRRAMRRRTYFCAQTAARLRASFRGRSRNFSTSVRMNTFVLPTCTSFSPSQSGVSGPASSCAILRMFVHTVLSSSSSAIWSGRWNAMQRYRLRKSGSGYLIG